jgi:acyl carrier protein
LTAAESTKLTADHVFVLLRKIIARDFRVPEDAITLDASLEALDLDSVDAVDMAVSVEQEVGFKFQPEHLQEIRTLQDVVDVVVAGVHSTRGV